MCKKNIDWLSVVEKDNFVLPDSITSLNGDDLLKKRWEVYVVICQVLKDTDVVMDIMKDEEWNIRLKSCQCFSKGKCSVTCNDCNLSDNKKRS